MKLLEKRTKAGVDGSAADVLDVTMLVIRLVRAEIRRTRPAGLSLNQVRALGCVAKTPDASLSRVADTLGLALPSASHLVDGLVRRKLLRRRPGTTDRRRLRLTLTRQGERSLDQAIVITRRHVAGRMTSLTAAERAVITEAMRILRPVLGNDENGTGR